MEEKDQVVQINVTAKQGRDAGGNRIVNMTDQLLFPVWLLRPQPVTSWSDRAELSRKHEIISILLLLGIQGKVLLHRLFWLFLLDADAASVNIHIFCDLSKLIYMKPQISATRKK